MQQVKATDGNKTILAFRVLAGAVTCAGGYVLFNALRDLVSLRFHSFEDYFGVFVLLPAMFVFGGWCLRKSYLVWRRPSGKDLVQVLIFGFILGYIIGFDVVYRIMDCFAGARRLYDRYTVQVMFVLALLLSLLYYRCRYWLSVHGEMNTEQREALRQPPLLRWSQCLGYWLWFAIIDIFSPRFPGFPFEERFSDSPVLQLLLGACLLILPIVIARQFYKRLHRHLCRLMASAAPASALEPVGPPCS